MTPASSVSGWYFNHPDSKYFGVGKLAATRWRTTPGARAGRVAEAEKWLGPYLDYDTPVSGAGTSSRRKASHSDDGNPTSPAGMSPTAIAFIALALARWRGRPSAGPGSARGSTPGAAACGVSKGYRPQLAALDALVGAT